MNLQDLTENETAAAEWSSGASADLRKAFCTHARTIQTAQSRQDSRAGERKKAVGQEKLAILYQGTFLTPQSTLHKRNIRPGEMFEQTIDTEDDDDDDDGDLSDNFRTRSKKNSRWTPTKAQPYGCFLCTVKKHNLQDIPSPFLGGNSQSLSMF